MPTPTPVRSRVARLLSGSGRHARPRAPWAPRLSWPGIPRRLPRHRVTALRRDPYEVFRGPHRRTAVTSTAAGALLLGVTLAAVPGSAVARTVRPTTPGPSAFTAARLPSSPAPVVQVAKPGPYRMPGGAAASRAAVAVAANLAGASTGAPAPGPAAQPTPPPAPAPPPGPAWSAPAPGAPVSEPFGVPDRAYAAGYHTGVDFAVDTGTPLLAVGDATVVSAGWNGAYGNEVVLRLSDGRFAQYAHLSAFGVRAGERVTGGQRIGAAGSTGNSTGPHLHFEIRTANRYGAVIDPVGYLSGHGVSDF
ncbi:M23 family metallopeptidase [Kitasatospora sp. RB6PN24]|uniref:M23 family metallopeptidase n=1 Tax=Kitasatospora humi TaxID=2893891 RepID=UPI001E50E3E0|nr:M23 family metallopeptidase [Kitasatospora humi]MCC9311369.1 M23 family metallopeptidase [Kitasatospora humi]